jgi:hypothetical protein
MRTLILGLALAVGLATAADAGAVKSIYTSIDLDRCRVTASSESFTTWACPGTADSFDLVLSEHDQRFLVGYGKPAAGSRASTQTLKALNSIFKPGRSKATMEWRLERQGGRWVPFATILRYFTSSDASGTTVKGQVLVVSRVGGADGSDSCHVAYVDARANKDAIELAIKAADELARGFDCQKEPTVIGKSGKSPM